MIQGLCRASSYLVQKLLHLFEKHHIETIEKMFVMTYDDLK